MVNRASWGFLLLLVTAALTRALLPEEARILELCAKEWKVHLSRVLRGTNIGPSGRVVKLHLSGAGLSGQIPSELTRLADLTALILQYNNLTGSIPASLGNLTALEDVSLQGNTLTGTIPLSIGRLTGLQDLRLSSNGLSGTIPSSLQGLVHLSYLSLSYNNLDGPIPPTISQLTSLRFLHLDHNSLSGSIVDSLSELRDLVDLHIGGNDFSGSIPHTLSSLTGLGSLHLDSNNLTGTIPTSLSLLVMLSDLHIANNSLSGTLPEELMLLMRLKEITLPVEVACPNYSTHSHALCALKHTISPAFCRACPGYCATCLNDDDADQPIQSVLPINSSDPGRAIIAAPEYSEYPSGSEDHRGGVPYRGMVVMVTLLSVLVMVAVAGYVVWQRRGEWFEMLPKLSKTKRAASKRNLLQGTTAVYPDSDPNPSTCQRFSLQQMLHATDSWSPANELGSGAFGTVYKGHDPNDPTVLWAVKRAKLLTHDFRREIEAVAGLRHPNVVRLLGFCVEYDAEKEQQEQIVVYEFVSGGDLKFRMLSGDHLSLEQRIDILLCIARGLEYLHANDIVHRDVKPPNILLDADGQAKVADFGLLKEVVGSVVTATQVVGTPGYVDPAYACSRIPAPACDVYSYGILMLEMLTAREVVDEEGGMVHIRKWAEQTMESGHIDLLKDPTLDCSNGTLHQLATLALKCTCMPTAVRPQMRNVVVELETLRTSLMGPMLSRHASHVDRSMRSPTQRTLAAEINELMSRT